MFLCRLLLTERNGLLVCIQPLAIFLVFARSMVVEVMPKLLDSSVQCFRLRKENKNES